MIPHHEKHPSLARSFLFAIEGIYTAFKQERNFKIISFLALVAMILAVLLKFDIMRWCILLLLIGLMLFAELINTAIETVVDLACPELHPLAKLSKDIAAGAVMVLSIISLIIGAFLYLPLLLAYLL